MLLVALSSARRPIALARMRLQLSAERCNEYSYGFSSTESLSVEVIHLEAKVPSECSVISRLSNVLLMSVMHSVYEQNAQCANHNTISETAAVASKCSLWGGEKKILKEC